MNSTRPPLRAVGPVGRAAAVLACAVIGALVPRSLPAQSARGSSADSAADRVRDRHGYPFRTPAASPREPVHRLALLTTDRDTVRRTIALADLGDRLGFWIRRDPGGDVELAGAIHGGAFSRFDLAGPNQNFIEIHYRFGFLFKARMGGVAARLELYHVSSHLGDEFLVDTGTEPISTSREGLELLVQASPLPGLRVYGGPGLLLRSSRGYGTASARGGAEWESSASGSRAFVSAELFVWSELSWEAAAAFEAGAALGRHARLGLLLGLGPSRAEQFFRDTETLFGLSVSYVR